MSTIGPVILFVCEHGSAKSTIAAAHFNKLARDGKLNARAISRGTDPDDTYPRGVTTGLHADGLDVEELRPKELSDTDILNAARIITFSQLPSEQPRISPIDDWSDVPAVSENYEIARDEIVRRVRLVIDELYRQRDRD